MTSDSDQGSQAWMMPPSPTQPALSHEYKCFGSQVPEGIKVGVRVSLIKSGDKFSGFKYNLTT